MVLSRAFSHPARRIGKFAGPVASGAFAALAIGFLLSPPVFRSDATIGVEDAAERFHPDAIHTAADLAVSRPVLVRAATSLIETHAVAAPPSVFERLGVLATSYSRIEQASHLADQLHAVVRTTPGAGAAALYVTAEAPDAAQAARIATTVASALVAVRDDSIADMRRDHDIAAASRLTALRSAASAAHQRLTRLAGTDADSAQVRASLIDQSTAAQARVATLRAIIASGTPPLGDGKDMPQSVEALQTTYLDLTRKLAVASQTLGDRHTTIIALQDGVRRAGAALTAEWKRLLRIAEADLAAARQREASLDGAAASTGASQAAIDEARRAARVADDALARTEAQRDLATDEQGYRLIAPAAVPLVPAAGWSLLARALLALAAGAAASGGALFVLARGRPEPAPEPAMEPHLDELPSHASPLAQEADVPPAVPAAANIFAEIPAFFDPEPEAEPIPVKDMSMPQTSPQSVAGAALDPDIQDALRDIVTELVMVEPAYGAVPTIMVAANEMASGTMAVALALANVAVERGMRALLVEGPRQKPELAAAAEPDCEPMLIDLFGSLRIILQAEGSDALFVAPFFKNGTSIAAALARNTQAPFLDDVAAEYDIIIVDGCRAADSAAAGLAADAYLRVGRFASRRETDRFLTTLDVSPDHFVGTVAGPTFVPRERDRASWRPAAPPPVEAPAASLPSRTAMPPQAGAAQANAFRASAQAPSVSTRPAYSRRIAVR